VSGELSRRIGDILDERRRGLPRVRREIEWWERVDAGLTDLAAAVADLRDHPATPAGLAEALAGFRVEEAREGVAEAVQLLRVLETRFSRDTINLGVSGQARVGKSTLLQAISGLDDDQIPTGVGVPVTAVRSRIHHSRTLARATLHLHTFDSFAADVLVPYHAELELLGVPRTAREFGAWPYPEPGGSDVPDRPGYTTILKRLRDMQASLPTFQADLVGGERVVGLDELRQFVAYPTTEQLRGPGPVPRRYLAVRDVRIECAFPHAQVEHLAVIDLPGLGEVAVRAEAHHIEGLQNEVDVVLMVKRPVEGMAYWGGADARALDLLDLARGFVAPRDFVFLVLNTGGIEAPLSEALRDDVRRQVNVGEPDRFFRVLEADAADTVHVYARVLTPVLAHLAQRLPAMDADVLAGTQGQCRAAADRIGVLAADLGRVLATVPAGTRSAEEDVDARSRRLRQDLAAGLQELVIRLRQHARDAAEDPEYLDAVEQAYQSTREWITGGLGVGEQAWRDEGLRRMRVDRFSGGYAGDELNRVRVEISGGFEQIDTFFTHRIEQMWADVAEVLGPAMGELLEARTGADALRTLAEQLDRAQPPCPRLRRAVEALLGVRLDYRSQLHPRVRSELDGLALEIPDPQTGRPRVQIAVEPTDAGAEQLYHFVVRMAEQAAYLTKKALLAEAVTPALVLHAAAEQFEDTLIRSGDSELEFRRLGRSYKHELWPGVYQEMDAANARFGAVVRARDALVASLESRRERTYRDRQGLSITTGSFSTEDPA